MCKNSFLQSYEWGNLQEKLGKKVFKIQFNGKPVFVLEQKLPFGKNYLYVPRGPIFAGNFSSESLSVFVKEIKNIADSDKSIFLRIEPPFEYSDEVAGVLSSSEFSRTLSVQPIETRVIDLLKSESELLKEMEHDTRYAIRVAERRGVTVSIFSDADEKKKKFDDFWKVFYETNKRRKLKHYPREYYKLVAELGGEYGSKISVAYLNSTAVASAIIVSFGSTATYLYAASLPGYGKYNAPSLILWRAILDAKKEGRLIFDLWGTSSEKKEWAGVTAFKKSFGGNLMSYVGTWDFVFKPAWYKLYKAVKKFIL